MGLKESGVQFFGETKVDFRKPEKFQEQMRKIQESVEKRVKKLSPKEREHLKNQIEEAFTAAVESLEQAKPEMKEEDLAHTTEACVSLYIGLGFGLVGLAIGLLGTVRHDLRLQTEGDISALLTTGASLLYFGFGEWRREKERRKRWVEDYEDVVARQLIPNINKALLYHELPLVILPEELDQDGLGYQFLSTEPAVLDERGNWTNL